jgi:hypothetical protein
MYSGEPERDRPRYRLLRDQLDIYRRHGASWAPWTYKDVGLQGPVYARPDSPYLRQIAPVLAKKARLGADSWGGSDREVRNILDPIEDLFDKEFPDFNPFPWAGAPGSTCWCATSCWPSRWSRSSAGASPVSARGGPRCSPVRSRCTSAPAARGWPPCCASISPDQSLLLGVRPARTDHR